MEVYVQTEMRAASDLLGRPDNWAKLAPRMQDQLVRLGRRGARDLPVPLDHQVLDPQDQRDQMAVWVPLV